MRKIAVTVHHEDQTWWADSDDLPGFVAAAESLERLRAELSNGISFELEGEPFALIAFDESGATMDPESAVALTTAARTSWWTDTTAEMVGWAKNIAREPHSSTPAVAVP